MSEIKPLITKPAIIPSVPIEVGNDKKPSSLGVEGDKNPLTKKQSLSVVENDRSPLIKNPSSLVVENNKIHLLKKQSSLGIEAGHARQSTANKKTMVAVPIQKISLTKPQAKGLKSVTVQQKLTYLILISLALLLLVPALLGYLMTFDLDLVSGVWRGNLVKLQFFFGTIKFETILTVYNLTAAVIGKTFLI